MSLLPEPRRSLRLAYGSSMRPEPPRHGEADQDDPAIAELSAIEDADELCRRLLGSAWGWGSSSRCAEAVELLAGVRGTGTLPDAFLAMLVCTCNRWGRVTGKLIAAIGGSGLLTDADLYELAESFLSQEVVIEYPFLWTSPRGLDLGSSDDAPPGFVVDEHTMATTRRRPEPAAERSGLSLSSIRRRISLSEPRCSCRGRVRACPPGRSASPPAQRHLDSPRRHTRRSTPG